MFGVDDNTQASNDDPAMLDNIKQLAAQPADQVEPPASVPTNMPDPANDAVSPVASPIAADEPAGDAPADAPSADIDNPAHLEVAEGFTSNPIIDDPVQPESSDQTMDEQPVFADSTEETASAPESGELSASDEASLSAAAEDLGQPTDMPTIVDEAPVIQSANGPVDASSAGPAQNDVSTPPELAAVEDTAVSAPSVDQGRLAGLKQEALGHLEPLTEHIDGSPEEIFRTTMQLIQANDNHNLLEKALEAAKNIEDDKERAQALLDIINEINYFAQVDNEQ